MLSGPDIVQIKKWWNLGDYNSIILACFFTGLLIAVPFCWLRRKRILKFCKSLLPITIWDLPKSCPDCYEKADIYNFNQSQIEIMYIKDGGEVICLLLRCKCGWIRRYFTTKQEKICFLKNNPDSIKQAIWD